MKLKKPLSALLILVLALALSGCKSGDYKKALELAANGDYAAGAAAFGELGDYKDSAEQLLGCNYQIALQALTDGDLKTAKDMFTALGSYEDSAEQIKECDYRVAEELLDAEDFEAAKKAFEALGDYKDSADLGKESGYSLAAKLLEEEDYEAAKKAFEDLGDYEDSSELAAQAGDMALAAKLVGRWISEPVDGTDDFMTGVNSGGQNIAQYIQFVPFVIRFELELTEDGMYYLTVNEESFNTTMDAEMEAIKTGMVAYLEASVAADAANNGQTLEAVYQAAGVKDIYEYYEKQTGRSLTDLLEQFLSAMDYSEIMDSFKEGGTFTVSDGSVIFGGDPADYDETAGTLTFTVEGHETTFSPAE